MEEVERMNRTLKEATVRRYHCDRHDQLRKPDRFNHDPNQLTSGLHT
jgi:hypothetical protein